MSTISPFREDVEFTGSTETVSYAPEDSETWHGAETEPAAESSPFAEATEAEEGWEADLDEVVDSDEELDVAEDEESDTAEHEHAETLPALEVPEESFVVGEELEAVDEFSPAERRSVALPLLSATSTAKAVAWNNARHPAVSGVDPGDIRAALMRYVDLKAVQAEIDSENSKGAGIALGAAPVNAVFVEAVHQFQRKCYIEPKQADGLVGESTLDSLGLVSRSPKFNTVDRVHAKTQKVLRRVAREIGIETGPRHTADKWFQHMVNPAFLGRTFTYGIHAVLAARLRIAERHLLAQPAFRGMTPAELGHALRIREDHRGARPHKPDSKSMHTSGLAVDINYAGNPWVTGSREASEKCRRDPECEPNLLFREVIDRATLLIGGRALGPNERLTPALLDQLSTRPTSEIHDVLARYDMDFRRYFGLDGALDAVRVRLLERQLQGQADMLGRLILSGESVDTAARRWLKQIRKDRDGLKAGSFSGREPRDGFLNLEKALVVALRDAAGLAWGAVDFGPRSCGDMMHFDCRRDGVGRIIAKELGSYVAAAPQWPTFSWGVWGLEGEGSTEGAEEEPLSEAIPKGEDAGPAEPFNSNEAVFEPEPFEAEADAMDESAQADVMPPRSAVLDRIAHFEASAFSDDMASFEEAESFFGRAAAAYRDAWDSIKTRVRIGTGVSDEKRLTDLVFFDRYPKRAGQPLSPIDSDFTTLRAEWFAIRDSIVRPALRAVKSLRYDRSGALAYARKFWLRPCDDQFIALASSSGKDFVRVDPGTNFEHEFEADGTSKRREHALLPDGALIPWEHLDDCTHFISCCIGERPGEACGGIKIAYHQLGAPPTAPYGITRVGTMVDYLTGRLRSHTRYAEIVAEKSEDDTLISQLGPGDLVAYFNKARKSYSHMALLLEENKIACHSYGRSDQPQCTWDNDWDLGRSTHQWTFIRFVV